MSAWWCLVFACFCWYIFTSVFVLSVVSPGHVYRWLGDSLRAQTPTLFNAPTVQLFQHPPAFSSFLWSNKMSKNPLISSPSCCSTLSFALQQRRLWPSCPYGFWYVLKHRSSLFLFACFPSSPLRWVYLIAFCGPPEVSTFNPRCFRPENAYIRVKIAMWEQVCALLSLFQALSQS